MKNIYLLSLVLLFTFSLNNLYSQWNPQIAPTGTADIYSVFAIDSTDVACSAYGSIPHTSNAGGSWVSNLTLSGVYLTTIHTAEPHHWYSMGYNSTWFIKQGNPSGISLTGGKPDSILSLHFSSPGCATGVGMAGKTVTTCDTGQTWQTRVQATIFRLNSVWNADANIGIACGNNGAICRTTNGGATWIQVNSPTIQNLKSVTFPTPTTGYICGAGGTILKTNNAGQIWTLLASGVPNNLTGIFFVDSLTGYVVGANGLIMNTTNGGNTWATMLSGTIQTLNSVHFASPSCGWAVGNGGTILKYGAIVTEVYTFKDDNSINIYPNPNAGNFNLSFNLSEASGKLFIKDMSGRLVYSQALNSSIGNEYVTTALGNGIYFWEIIGGNETLANGKMIIVK